MVMAVNYSLCGKILKGEDLPTAGLNFEENLVLR